MNKFSKLSVVGIAAATVLVSLADPPSWWASRGATNASPASDYAAANIGQAKNIAAQAVAEMDAVLPGGAGTALHAIVDPWSQPPGTGIVRSDYAVLNQGQLKNLAKPFYDRLAAAGYVGPPLTAGQSYPWPAPSGSTTDYASANLGQVKYIFSFIPSLANGSLDTDGDGMTNSWEYANNLDPTSAADAVFDLDGDGLSNLREFLLGTNPRADDRTATAVLHVLIPSGAYLNVDVASLGITP